MLKTHQLRVGFILAHNFTLAAFANFIDVLRLGADEGDHSCQKRCSWKLMEGGRRQILSSCGVAIQPTNDFVDPSKFDYIVVVGGILHSGAQLSAANADYLKNAASEGITLVGLCTGSFILCRLGLMKDRMCCISWFHYGDFVEEFPEMRPCADKLFVWDRDRITCAGGTAVVDVAATIVGRHLGDATAQKALHILLTDDFSRSRCQPAPPLHISYQKANRDIIARALISMEQNLSSPLSIAKLASCLQLSVRQLERLFRESLDRSPHEIYIDLRLRHAKWMLINTMVSTSRIGVELGFSDGPHFNRWFKVRFKQTPSQFRAKEQRMPDEQAAPPNLVAGSIQPSSRRIF